MTTVLCLLILLISAAFLYSRTTKRKQTVLYLLILLISAAFLYDQATKRIPTRLRADQAPISKFGIVPVEGFGSRSHADGLE